ncbi:MAG: sterol desaturase family protein [Rhodospirillales bacterium]|nr:sterol desaturase family protein [Rhodospirillales bacterium]QQS13666.1 MAG: sterol desaturase family protein [Rhodospirillales bacterium]
MQTPIGRSLSAPAASRRLGSGWLSGTVALFLGLVSLGAVLCVRYPALLTMPELRELYPLASIRAAMHVVMIVAFALGLVNIMLGRHAALGGAAMACVLAAVLLGGWKVEPVGELTSGVYLGLDWFLLNLIAFSVVWIPIERLWGRLTDQAVFREEWKVDLFYFFLSGLAIQFLAYVTLKPAMTLFENTDWRLLHEWVESQWLPLQFLEIMIVTDLVQYGVHYAFHRVPFLWRFHAVHHCAANMDWLAGSRLHLLDMLTVRATTAIPMIMLGFADTAVYAYLSWVTFQATLAHANVRWNFGPLKYVLTTPQFHHWHHAADQEGIDKNFAIHLPMIDKVFGTFYLPEGKWPTAYGIAPDPVPKGFFKQFLYPFFPRALERK